MTAETQTWLENNVLVGMTSKYGRSWWDRGASDSNGEDNHYQEAIPVADIERRLFNWTLESSPLILQATGQVIPGKQAVYRSDTKETFGIFGEESYNVHGYKPWLLDNVGALLQESRGDLVPTSAGLLQGGAVAWVQVENPQAKEVGGEKIRPFILATTSANGRYATSYKRGSTLVVCDNTLAEFHSANKDGVKVKHTRHSLTNIDRAREALELMAAHIDLEFQEIDRLMNTEVTDQMMSKVLDLVLDVDGAKTKHAATRNDRKRSEILSLYNNSPLLNHNFNGTAWGVVQAFNTYDQHSSQLRRDTIRFERNKLNFLTGKVEDHDQNIVSAINKVLATV